MWLCSYDVYNSKHVSFNAIRMHLESNLLTNPYPPVLSTAYHAQSRQEFFHDQVDNSWSISTIFWWVAYLVSPVSWPAISDQPIVFAHGTCAIADQKYGMIKIFRFPHTSWVIQDTCISRDASQNKIRWGNHDRIQSSHDGKLGHGMSRSVTSQSFTLESVCLWHEWESHNVARRWIQIPVSEKGGHHNF